MRHNKRGLCGRYDSIHALTSPTFAHHCVTKITIIGTTYQRNMGIFDNPFSLSKSAP
jgi:hypothetical protein